MVRYMRSRRGRRESKFSDLQVISKQQVDRYPSRVVKIVTIKMKSISHHQHTTQVGKVR